MKTVKVSILDYIWECPECGLRTSEWEFTDTVFCVNCKSKYLWGDK